MLRAQGTGDGVQACFSLPHVMIVPAAHVVEFRARLGAFPHWLTPLSDLLTCLEKGEPSLGHKKLESLLLFLAKHPEALFSLSVTFGHWKKKFKMVLPRSLAFFPVHYFSVVDGVSFCHILPEQHTVLWVYPRKFLSLKRTGWGQSIWQDISWKWMYLIFPLSKQTNIFKCQETKWMEKNKGKWENNTKLQCIFPQIYGALSSTIFCGSLLDFGGSAPAKNIAGSQAPTPITQTAELASALEWQELMDKCHCVTQRQVF